MQFTSQLIAADFVEYALDLALEHGLYDEARLEQFDAAILNPPYLKIGATSAHRRRLRHMGIEATNLYAAFVAIAIKMLRPGGELVAITPRSFCNGPYFRPFRQMLISAMSLRRIHIYESRSDTFRDDKVLQETVILHAIKKSTPPARVSITTGSQLDGIFVARDVPYAEVVRPHDPDVFIHIATNEDDQSLTDFVLRQPCTLSDLALEVSTGRVVDFRARDALCAEPEPGSVPLIYPAHFAAGFVHWPQAGKKPNAIRDVPATRELLVPSGCYVLTRRFTSKEERRRVVACIFDPARIPAELNAVGFENHLNYFHAGGQGIGPTLARGLAAYLNSTAVDRYFRQFSGHTQVNATDLRSLRYPARETLEALGNAVGDAVADQAAVDAAITVG